MLEETEFQVKINCINPVNHDLRVALLLKPLARTTLVWEYFLLQNITGTKRVPVNIIKYYL